MGEFADMMLDGTLCQQCGGLVNDAVTSAGYPVTCDDCKKEK